MKKINQLVPFDCFSGDIPSLLLHLIYKAETRSLSMGRRSLVGMARQERIAISKGALHKQLKKLQERGYLVIHQGRTGCRLTPKGFAYLSKK